MIDPSEIELFKKQRAAFKGQLSRFKTTIATSSTIGGYEALLRRLQLVYEKYDTVQTKLEVFDDSFAADRFNVEEDYVNLETILRNKIHECKKSEDVASSTPFLNTSNHEINPVSPVSAGIRLPEITLPAFDGKEADWLAFRDVFIDLIHSKNLEPTTKFLYLISSIRLGTAFRLIESLPVTASNYELAWTALCERYNNEISIQRLHMRELYEVRSPSEHSHRSLEIFLDKITKHYNALQSLKVAVTTWDLMLVHHLTQKLDHATRVYIVKHTKVSSLLSYSEFIQLLRTRVRILQEFPSKLPQASARFQRGQDVTLSAPSVSSKSDHSSWCPYCSASHSLDLCPGFTNERMLPSMRFQFVKDRHICGNCLLEHHLVRECTHAPCSICSLKHHTLLHFPIPQGPIPSRNSSRPHIAQSNQAYSVQEASSNANPNTSCIEASMPSTPSLSVMNTPKHILLIGTALVGISSANGAKIHCRALLDSGSTMNFITARSCALIKAKRYTTCKTVSGIGASETVLKHKTYLTISSLVSDFAVDLKLYIIPKITTEVPSLPFAFDVSTLPFNVQLADPHFNTPACVDLLLGAEIYHQLFKGSSIRLQDELPPFHDSELGYVVCGKSRTKIIPAEQSHPAVTMCSIQSLEESVKRFWELENIPSNPHWSHEATLCEEHYTSNVSRSPSGRYTVALPTKSNIQSLAQSYISAIRQFYALERRLSTREEIYTQYKDFMDEYLTLGHMAPANLASPYKSYHLPHHCVIKDQSTTTKLRVVFNASAKTSTQLSLNDCLSVGPTIQQDLVSILLRFRKHPFAFCGDIAKMYRQINVKEDQQDLQRILWRNHPSEKLKTYNLCTVTYGTACAPFLATRTLKQLALDEQNKFPKASAVLKDDFYVDDVLTGAPTVDEALKLKTNLIELLQLGGFELRKFFSNVDQLASKDQLKSSTTLILGLLWDTNSDRIEIQLDKLSSTSKCTKRTILSEICQLFDPLGLCSPIIITAKLFIQAIWMEQGITWDDSPPSEIVHKWNLFKQELHTLKQVSIPRFVADPNRVSIELHGFCDASERAYGCVVYIRTLDSHNNFKVRLLCSKTRVSPLKRETIPRLELCAAVLLSELVSKVIATMDMSFDSIYLWTDSKISLFRINSEAYKYATFVANRISKIQTLTSPSDWHYVNTKENPADIASRGLMPSQFESASLWWEGPEFLRLPISVWPSVEADADTQVASLELRKTPSPILIQQSQHIHSIFYRFNSITLLYRVVAYIFRFCNNAKSPTVRSGCSSKCLQPHEITKSALHLLKMVQQASYASDIQLIRRNHCLPARSSIVALSPFLDEHGILRVGGRLSNATIPDDHIYPALLPAGHIFSKLVARHEHLRLLHAGPQTLLYNLRMTYWIPGARNLCRKIVHECVRCFRTRPLTRHQIMGNLPADRVTKHDRPFVIVGVDFCGPFLLTQFGRPKAKIKCYICVFVCFSTKAVHLEIVLNTSTEAFIASLRRFISRRGICSKVYSDNATNFIGARSELHELQKLFESQSFQDAALRFCTSQNIEWITIPPRSPHFGGLWEAAIKSAKHHLKRVIGTSSFTVEEFLTLTTQIEACINSRPLTPMSNDPSDLQALTPAHFIIGAPLTLIPEPSLLELKTNRLSKFQQLQQSIHRFWERWHTEYLSELQRRNKWKHGSFSVRIGLLVLLHDDNLPPLKWNLGRITALHPGKDGIVRVVTVKTALSEMKRAVNRISILPIDDSEASSSTM